LHVVAHVSDAGEVTQDRDITLLYKVEPGKCLIESPRETILISRLVRYF
jgi:hypothetical protein